MRALATLLSGFIIAKFISPSDFGLWTALSILISYALIFQGGLINGLNLELPLALGEGDVRKGHLYAAVTQSGTAMVTVMVLAVGVLTFFTYPFSSDKERFGFAGIVLIICCTYFQNYFLSTFRSNNQFLKLSYIQIAEALLNFVTIALVFYYGFYGLVLKAVSVIFIYVIVLAFYRPIKVHFVWKKKIFIKLLKVGLPIFALAYVEVFALTLDKVFLLRYTNLQSVGIYSFAFYAFAFTTLFSNSLASYIYPKLTYKYGETKNKLILWQYVKRLTTILLIIQIPFVLVGLYVIPLMVNHYFPQYVLSIIPMQLLLVAGVLKGATIGSNVMWSIKKWKYMIIYQVAYASAFIVFIYMFVNIFENKIIGVSAAVAVANLLNLINCCYLSYKATNSN